MPAKATKGPVAQSGGISGMFEAGELTESELFGRYGPSLPALPPFVPCVIYRFWGIQVICDERVFLSVLSRSRPDTVYRCRVKSADKVHVMFRERPDSSGFGRGQRVGPLSEQSFGG